MKKLMADIRAAVILIVNENRTALQTLVKNATRLLSRLLAAFSIGPQHVLAGSGQPVPSEKTNVGCVGVV